MTGSAFIVYNVGQHGLSALCLLQTQNFRIEVPAEESLTSFK